MKERGFTLVEMLIALTIFAAIAGIGVGLLRASVDTQGAVQDRLGAMGSVNRMRSVMANDLSQAVLRPVRGADGATQPAFSGDAQGFTLVQRGRLVDDASAQSAVQRVRWALIEGEWRRATTIMTDGMVPGEGDAFARKVSSAVVRYRDAKGAWRGVWSTETERQLPVAVEVVVTRDQRAPLVMRFRTGPTLLPQAPPPASKGAAP